jgi:GGDEF domain-containing protein
MEDRVAGLKIPGVNAAVVLDYGIASCPGDGNDLVEAIGVADARMYENKARRKAETA